MSSSGVLPRKAARAPVSPARGGVDEPYSVKTLLCVAGPTWSPTGAVQRELGGGGNLMGPQKNIG